MTKKRLEEYRSEKQEIEELKYRLQTLKAQDYTGVDTILDYRSGYPVPRAIVGTDIDTYWAIKNRLQSEITRLTARCQEVEQWIEEIPESTIRRIFRMHYVDGQGQQAIGKQMHIDQSNVSRKINYYLKANVKK